MPRVDSNVVDETTATESRRGPHTAGVVISIVVVVLLLTLLAARMVPHPVGPARTYGKYHGKAVSTAQSALSDVQTAALVARANRDGNTFGPYTSVVISDAEESTSGVQGTFDSIQPPDTRADALQQRLDGLLSDALEHVRAARVAVRRGDRTALTDLVAALETDAHALEDFTEASS
jgi:hypothetical protein